MKLTLTICTLLLSSLSAYAKKDPVDYANYLRANKANAIVADSILGRVTPLFTGYSTINDAVPVPVLVNCHYGGTYVGQADQSKDAQTYLKNIEYIAADGYQPVTVMQRANTYNQSWVRQTSSLQSSLAVTANCLLVCYWCSLVDHCIAAISLCS